jgi:purine-nucleoside phosphorylase
MNLFDKIESIAAHIRQKTALQPEVGIILGSGLGGLVDMIDVTCEIPYASIPGFPQATVAGHAGKFVFGKVGAKTVMLMAGRFHYYEGYSMEEVTLPVRVMKSLGVSTLFISNASGGTNPSFSIGDIMFITDHINLFPEHPLRGKNDERLGVRFPDMSEAYSKSLIVLGEQVAATQGVPVRKGVYIGLQGPTFETPSEYRWLHRIGGDAVGMSTVPETIVARHAGLQVFALSVITDLGVTDVPVTITHEEVLEAANAAAPKMAALVQAMILAM